MMYNRKTCEKILKLDTGTVAVVSPFAFANPFMEFHVSFCENPLFLLTRNRNISWISEISIFLAFRYLSLDFWVFFGDCTLVTSGADFYLEAFWPLVKTQNPFVVLMSNI